MSRRSVLIAGAATVAVASLGIGSAHAVGAWGGYSNGYIPAAALARLSWATSKLLRQDAASDFERLNTAYRARFGVSISVTDAYRTYAQQVALRASKGNLAAIPGTSNHGWALAVDLGGGINTSYSTTQYLWMAANAPGYGWVNPNWARSTSLGGKGEPWHWEYLRDGGGGAPTTMGNVFEAASNNAWRNLPPGLDATALAATTMNGVKYIYTVNNGQVYEAASNNGWQSLPMGIAASAVAATSMNGVKYVYTLNGGQVYEAASNNGWQNLPPGIPGSALAVTSMNGVKYIYTVNNGQVYESASNNGWQNLPMGIAASAVAATSMNGVKYVYTLNGGQVYEAASNNGWQNLPPGIAGSALAVTSMNGVKYVYTLNGGQVYEAASNNGWQSLPPGIAGSALAVTSMNGVKYIYTINNDGDS